MKVHVLQRICSTFLRFFWSYDGFFVSFGYEGLKARTSSTTECNSLAAGSKSGCPKYRVLVTGVKCMCGDVNW